MWQALGSPEMEALRKASLRWTGLVERSLNGRAPGVSPGEYEELHKDILIACRVLRARTGRPMNGYCQQLEDLLLPWLSLDTVQKADGAVLGSVLARIRELERRLGIRHRQGVGKHWIVGFVTAAVVVGFGLAIAYWNSPFVIMLMDWLEGWRFRLVHGTGGDRLIVGGAVITLLAMVLLHRSARG